MWIFMFRLYGCKIKLKQIKVLNWIRVIIGLTNIVFIMELLYNLNHYMETLKKNALSVWYFTVIEN